MPAQCSRSHPHELMDDVCAEKTKTAKAINGLAHATAEIGRLQAQYNHVNDIASAAADLNNRQALRIAELERKLAKQQAVVAVDKPCSICKGAGKLDDSSIGDIFFNEWECPECKRSRISRETGGES